MMWQMWTAFGIMLGYVADLAFYKVPDKPHIKGLNWRLMLASVIVSIYYTTCSFIYLKINEGRYARTLPNGPSLSLPRITALAHVKGSIYGCVRVAKAAPPPSRTGCSRSLLSVTLSSHRTILTSHQTFTCSSRRRPSSLTDETAILSCSRSPVTVARLLPPSSSCLCKFSNDGLGPGFLTPRPGSNSAASTLLPTTLLRYSHRPTLPRYRLSLRPGALVP